MQGWGHWLDLVFPRACALCSTPLVDLGERGLCGGCFGRVDPIDDGCLRCGAPMGHAGPPKSKRKRSKGGGCPTCQKKSLSMTRVFAFSVYAGASLRIARKMKETRHEALAEQMGRSVAHWLMQGGRFAVEHYDAMIPIPQHWFRRLATRYNQSEALANGIAACVLLPIEDRWLQRARWTPKQGMKTIVERQENMFRAFQIPEKHAKRVQGKRFLLVDDVMTSGATLDQAAWALKQKGALMVDAVVFARGLGATRPTAPRTGENQDFASKIRRTEGAEAAY
jgi:predicted amidophosphoribosyltransferase